MIDLMKELERRISGQAMGEVRMAIRSMGGFRAVVRSRPMLVEHEIALARKLLQDGLTRSEARAALMVRLRCKRSKAYELLDRALAAGKLLEAA